MKIDEVQIFKYVNQELNVEQRQQFESIMRNDSELQEQVQAMQASKLPYEAAFNAEPLPAMPTHLQDHVQQLTRVAKVRPVDSLYRTWWLVAGISLAFLAGSLVSYSIQHWKNVEQSAPLQAYDEQRLIDAMIQYQALYIRETVEPVNQKMSDAVPLIQQFNQSYQTNLVIPDLASRGYEFRRAQQLAFEAKSIIQMVYLPQAGKPIALCASKTHLADREMQAYRYAGINSYVWIKDGLVYMLMGDYSAEQLKSIIDSIV